MAHAYHALDPNNPKRKEYRVLADKVKRSGADLDGKESFETLKEMAAELQHLANLEASAKSKKDSKKDSKK